MASRRVLARHARHGSPPIWRQVLTTVAVSLSVVLVAALGVGGYTAWSLSSQLTNAAVELEDAPQQPPAIGAYEGAFDVLIVGTDECEPDLVAAIGTRCTGADAGGQLNDVNLLVHVSASPRRVTVVSFPRDLQIPVPSCRLENGGQTSALSKQAINAVYGIGGLPCVATTVSQLSGQSIPFAAKVSFGNVVRITDAIGGVEVCIGGNGIRDPYTQIDWEAGPRTVQGLDALQFLRTRKGVGDGSDLARIGNQQQYLSRLLNKVRSDEVLGDPARLFSLAGTAVNNVEPSTSLADPLRMVQLGMALKDVPLSEVAFVQYPVNADPDDSDHVVPNRAAADALWDALAKNAPIDLTGRAGSNGGVVSVDPAPAPETTAAPPSPEQTAPGEEAVALPSAINGTKADQATCSAGRGR
jgi:LCP family protein required for cell wall assembly